MISRVKQKDIIKIIYHPDFEIDYPTASWWTTGATIESSQLKIVLFAGYRI